MYPLDRGLWVGPDGNRYLGLRHVSIDKDAVSIFERDDWTESCWTDSLALCKSGEVIRIASTSCVIEWNTSPGHGVISPSGQAGVSPVLAVPLIYELGARDVSSSPPGRMCTRGAALLATHEPVVVSPAARVGELSAEPGLPVVAPARVIAQTGALGQGLAAHGDLGPGQTQRLTLTTRQESVSVSETASVLELSVVNINQFPGPQSIWVSLLTCRGWSPCRNATPCTPLCRAPSLAAGDTQLTPGASHTRPHTPPRSRNGSSQPRSLRTKTSHSRL